MDAVYEHGDVAPATALVAIVATSVVLLVLAVLARARARRRDRLAAEEAAALRDPAGALREGECVLSGVVEHAPGHDVAVRVEITQHGTESESSGSWSHRWTEVDRRVVVAPFFLKLPDGTRVRVEPPRDVDVADDLDRKVLISRRSRVRSAELVPGEVIHARGRLERGGDASPEAATGYRDVEWGWVLRPARRRMMLSSRPLGEGLRQRAVFHRFYSGVAVFVLAVFHVSLAGYYTRACGRVEQATVLDTKHERERDGDGDLVDTYLVTVKLSDRVRPTTREVDADAYRSARAAETIPVRRGALNSSYGARPTAGTTHLLVAAIGTALLLIAYHRRRQGSRPWFRRRVDEQGSGRLSNPS